jgi:DNA invertase Pin-like site-specific DNA recombinase
MKVAIYIRVSKEELNPENQKIELEKYAKAMDWEYEIFEEKESTRKARPIKKQLFDLACNKKYDGILILKLDRWARSLQELINDLGILNQNKVRFQSLKENIILDNDPRNMLMIHILGAFAEFERAIIRERTMAGLYRARLEGRVGGRPRKKPLPTKSDILNGENWGDNNGGFS